MAFSGLETLFQNLGPATAGMVAGGREAQAREAENLAQLLTQQNIQEKTLSNDRYGQLTPYEVTKAGLGNQKLEAELPGVRADSGTKQLALDEATALSKGKIALGQAQAQTGLTGEHIKQLGMFNNTLQTISPILASTPPAAHHAIISDALQQAGLDKDPHMVSMMKTFSNLPPDKVGGAVQSITDWINKNTAAYTQAQMQAGSQEKIHAADNTTRIKIEQMGIDAGKYKNRLGGVGGLDKAVQAFQKLPLDRQSSRIDAALSFGVDPISNEEIDEAGAAQWRKVQAKIKAELDQKDAVAAAKSGVGVGVTATTTDGRVKIENKPSIQTRIGKGTAADPIVLK